MLTMVGLGAASVPQFSVCCGGWTACESRAQPRTEEEEKSKKTEEEEKSEKTEEEENSKKTNL